MGHTGVVGSDIIISVHAMMIVYGCMVIAGSHIRMSNLWGVVNPTWWNLTVAWLISILIEILVPAMCTTVDINYASTIVIE